MGNGAGAGYAAGLVNRLCGGLSVAEYPETAVYPALWPASRAVYRSDDRHRGAVFWVGALCWNIASQKLPTVILGPLIVFETLAGLLYTFILRRNPAIPDVKRHCAPVAGVVIAVRAKPEKATVVPVTER